MERIKYYECKKCRYKTTKDPKEYERCPGCIPKNYHDFEETTKEDYEYANAIFESRTPITLSGVNF